MPSYPYLCSDCSFKFEVIKRVKDIDCIESCKKCGSNNTFRKIALSNIDKTSTAQPYYEPALGCVINSNGHKKRILKDRGLEEVGNTSTESLYRQLEVPKMKEIDKSWDKV